LVLKRFGELLELVGVGLNDGWIIKTQVDVVGGFVDEITGYLDACWGVVRVGFGFGFIYHFAAYFGDDNIHLSEVFFNGGIHVCKCGRESFH